MWYTDALIIIIIIIIFYFSSDFSLHIHSHPS
jgi:hypothetical protein